MDPVTQYSFTYEEQYSSDLRSLARNANNDIEVSLAAGVLTPRRVLNVDKVPQDTKLIFLSRHAPSPHNRRKERHGKQVYYEFFAHDSVDVDPKLGPDGEGEASRIGAAMRATNLPRPTSFYTSPLSRCIATAICVAKALGGSDASIQVEDGLREWMGWDHNHSSDRRMAKAEITRYFASQANLKFGSGFAEEDAMAAQGSAYETYEDVRIRIERTLNDIFDRDKSPAIHISLHGRCFRYFLRAIGHEEAVDLANCATVVFLVQRKALAVHERAAKLGLSEERAQGDRDDILREKDRVTSTALAIVRGMSDQEAEQVRQQLLKGISEAVASGDVARQTERKASLRKWEEWRKSG